MSENILVFLEEELKKLEEFKELPTAPESEPILMDAKFAEFTAKITEEIDYLKVIAQEPSLDATEKEALAYITKLKDIIPTLHTNSQQESAMKSVTEAISKFDTALIEKRLSGLEVSLGRQSVSIDNWDEMPMNMGKVKVDAADLASEATLQAVLAASGGALPYDNISVNTTDPASIVITKLSGETVVDVKTINII